MLFQDVPVVCKIHVNLFQKCGQQQRFEQKPFTVEAEYAVAGAGRASTTSSAASRQAVAVVFNKAWFSVRPGI